MMQKIFKIKAATLSVINTYVYTYVGTYTRLTTTSMVDAR